MNKVIGGESAITKTLLQKRDNICQIPFGAGRSAFYYILKEIKEFGGNILVPNFLCESLTQTVIDAKWIFDFYHINRTFDFEVSELPLDGNYDAILLINYFGIMNYEKRFVK